MFSRRTFSVAALGALLAAPLAAQDAGTVRDRVEASRRTAETARRSTLDSILVAARGERIDATARAQRGSGARIPPGHLPPRGMCRVWIDGVPPGQQPSVTSCAQAESDRFRHGTNARVIYGDSQAFPGKGKGKFKERGDRDDDDDDLLGVLGGNDDRLERSRSGKRQGKVNKGRGRG